MNKYLLALSFLLIAPAICIAQIDTNTVVSSWKLDEYFANQTRMNVDTALDQFQKYNPAFCNYTGVATLGNYSLPAQSLVFTERLLSQEFILINHFYPFMKSFTTTEYFNCRRPFTKLTYIKGGSSQTNEEILDVLHSQNITKEVNFGLHYTTLGSLGQYRFQKVKNNSFGFFSSKSGEPYSYHLSINWNKITADENGGVLKDSYVTDTSYSFTKDIPTLFGGKDRPPQHIPDAYTEIRNLNIFTKHEFAFLSERQKSDSVQTTKKIRIFYPKLIYIFLFDRTVRSFTDNNPTVGFNAGLYPAMNISGELTSDSLLHWRLQNTARLQFQGRKNNHYFIDYSYELLKYSMSTGLTSTDTTEYYWFITNDVNYNGLHYNSRLYNSYISSGFNKIFVNRLELDLLGRLYLSGYRTGDIYLAGDIKVNLGKLSNPFTLSVSAVNELRSPDYLYAHYASNHFIWTKNFKQTFQNHLSAKIDISSKKFEIQGDYYLFRNFIFFNDEALPAQYHSDLSILAVSASKQFNFWKITSYNKLVFQKCDNEKILGLPELTFNTSTYLSHLFNFKSTGGKLLTMVGFDMSYNTKYYADAYMPALSTFYRQYEKPLGNYPYFDVFLNVQLKRFRFFLKMEHVNSGWINKNYFTVLHYPRNQRELKFGLSWTFYD
jgi:hypothetical protein